MFTVFFIVSPYEIINHVISDTFGKLLIIRKVAINKAYITLL
jgi:hypothetical protein